MAKTQNTETVETAESAPEFVIGDFVSETAAENPYIKHVDALIQAGPGKFLTITVPRGTRRDETPGDGSRDRLLFQQAANAAGYTARQRKAEVVDDTTINLTFTLGEKNKRAGKPRDTNVLPGLDETAAE